MLTKIPPRLSHSLHYLVKYLCSKHRHAQGVSAAKCRVRLRHSKTVSKYMSDEISSILFSNRKMFTSAIIKNRTTDCTQLLQQRERCRGKMPYTISSRSVTDGESLSVSKSKLVYRSLISVDNKKGKGSPYSIAERRVPELIPILSSQPAGDVIHIPGGRLPLLSARPAVTLATLTRAATNFVDL